MTTRDKLKEYFKTGAKPTQEQFAELIDSFRHKNDDIGDILHSLQGSVCMGEAKPTDTPAVSSLKVFYFAKGAGVYNNFAGIELAVGETAVLLYNGTNWSKITLFEVAQELGDREDVGVSQLLLKKTVSNLSGTQDLANVGKEVIENGFFFVDVNGFVGVKMDQSGLHSINTIEI